MKKFWNDYILSVVYVECKKLSVKFIYSEKATKFCEIFTLLLITVHTGKSKLKILQNFVAFSEYMNFIGEDSRAFMHTKYCVF